MTTEEGQLVSGPEPATLALFGARAAEWEGRVALLDAHFQVLTAIGRLLKTLDTSLGGEAPAQASP